MITFCYNDHRDAKNEAEDFIIDNIKDGILVTNHFECDSCLIVYFGLDIGFDESDFIEFFENITEKLYKTKFNHICYASADCEDKSLIFDYKEEVE